MCLAVHVPCIQAVIAPLFLASALFSYFAPHLVCAKCRRISTSCRCVPSTPRPRQAGRLVAVRQRHTEPAATASTPCCCGVKVDAAADARLLPEACFCFCGKPKGQAQRNLVLDPGSTPTCVTFATRETDARSKPGGFQHSGCR